MKLNELIRQILDRQIFLAVGKTCKSSIPTYSRH